MSSRTRTLSFVDMTQIVGGFACAARFAPALFIVSGVVLGTLWVLCSLDFERDANEFL